MVRKLTVLTTFVLALALGAWGQSPSFTLIQPRNTVQGQRFALSFRLTDGEANPPQAPELENCTLLYGPSTSTMQSTTIVNGRMTSTYSTDYTFTYRANEPGQVTVPAVTVNAGGKNISSRPATFNILPADNPQQGSRPQGSNVRPQDAQIQQPGKVNPDDVLVKVTFSKNSVYEQEPVVATIKVYTQYNITSFLPTTQPAFEGFLTEEIPMNVETQIEHYNGRNYYTAVLKKLLLYPQKAGTLTVNSGRYDITIEQDEIINMGFFRTTRPVEKHLTTSSNAATLTVRALPEPRPAGFNGAVGQFTANVGLSPEMLKTNEAAVYSYTVKGTGNIKFLSEPAVDFPSGVDVYTPKTDIDTHLAGANMAGTFTTDFTIIPQETGQLTIPGCEFVYFDPNTSEYKTVEIAPVQAKVLPGVSTSTVTEQTAVAEIKDIRHIHDSRKAKIARTDDFVVAQWWYWTIYAVIISAMAGTVLANRRKIRLDADITGRKLARANKVANKRLRQAREYMNRHDNEQFYQSLAKALWGYVSDKLSIAPSQLMRDNIAEKLQAYGASPESIDAVLAVLDECEMARFTPQHSEDQVTELYNQAVNAIKGIEDVRAGSAIYVKRRAANR